MERVRQRRLESLENDLKGLDVEECRVLIGLLEKLHVSIQSNFESS
jgi:hypothetical protein